jgi:hypothetical protein
MAKTGAFVVKDVVRCLAIRFDDEEDSMGRTWSMRHLLAGHGAWAVGTTTYLHADKKHAKVKWDDGGHAIKSAFRL